MRKILIFSLAYFPKHVGGAEVAIKEKTDRMPDSEFHMITLRYDSSLPKVEKIGNVLVHRIGFSRPDPSMGDLKRFPLHLNKYWFQFAAAYKAISLYREYRYDAIWAMMAHSCGVPAALFKIAYPKVPYILELQEGDPPEYIERLMRPLWPLFSRAFTTADMVSVISNFLGDWARRRGFKGEVVLIPNAVNAQHFTQDYSRDELSAAREKLGKRAGDIYVVTTSRLVHKNAVDDVIRAIALLPEHIHFLIYGIGPDEAMLRKLADDLGVASRTHFAGQIGHAEMPLALKACDIFTRPSRSEGMGNSFIEAMAAGLPVIATQEGGIADFLADSVRNPDKETTGWAVDKDSPGQIAAAVGDILAHPEQVARVVATAKAMAIEKYDWGLIAAQMKSAFDRVFSNAMSDISCPTSLDTSLP
ncbi:MAG TPA: glycosyltransferase [Candidatus Paceibacterota bacterium]|nr:glycosyltransferase [Candidatus Paceibacterota bacterium]